MNDEDKTKLSISTFRKINKDDSSTNEEIEEIVNSLYELSIIVYNMNKNIIK